MLFLKFIFVRGFVSFFLNHIPFVSSYGSQWERADLALKLRRFAKTSTDTVVTVVTCFCQSLAKLSEAEM
jgi:hypothetical protein